VLCERLRPCRRFLARMISSTPALSKLTHYSADEDLRLKKNYHATTHFDQVPGLSGTCSMEYPSAVQPPSGEIPHFAMMAGTFTACLLSRRRHQEKWWLGGILMCVGYFVSAKFHRQGNGAQGHNGGVFLSTLGTVGMCARSMGNAGSPWFNVGSVMVFAVMGWYDWGMAHQWTAYLGQFKKEIGTSKIYETSLWIEQVPQNVATEFVHFRPLHGTPDAYDWPQDVVDLVSGPRGSAKGPQRKSVSTV
jgi:hypothetical protein